MVLSGKQWQGSVLHPQILNVPKAYMMSAVTRPVL